MKFRLRNLSRPGWHASMPLQDAPRPKGLGEGGAGERRGREEGNLELAVLGNAGLGTGPRWQKYGWPCWGECAIMVGPAGKTGPSMVEDMSESMEKEWFGTWGHVPTPPTKLCGFGNSL